MDGQLPCFSPLTGGVVAALWVMAERVLRYIIFFATVPVPVTKFFCPLVLRRTTRTEYKARAAAGERRRAIDEGGTRPPERRRRRASDGASDGAIDRASGRRRTSDEGGPRPPIIERAAARPIVHAPCPPPLLRAIHALTWMHQAPFCYFYYCTVPVQPDKHGG